MRSPLQTFLIRMNGGNGRPTAQPGRQTPAWEFFLGRTGDCAMEEDNRAAVYEHSGDGSGLIFSTGSVIVLPLQSSQLS